MYREIEGLFIILLYDRQTERKVDVLGLICVIEELATLLLCRETKAKKIQSLELYIAITCFNSALQKRFQMKTGMYFCLIYMKIDFPICNLEPADLYSAKIFLNPLSGTSYMSFSLAKYLYF